MSTSRRVAVLNPSTGDPFSDSLLPAVLRSELGRRLAGVEMVPLQLLQRGASPRGECNVDAVLLGDGSVRLGPDFLHPIQGLQMTGLCVLAGGAFPLAELEDQWNTLVGRPPSREVPTLCCQASTELHAQLMTAPGSIRSILARHYSRALLVSGPGRLDMDGMARKLGQALGLEVHLTPCPSDAAGVAALVWGADGFLGTGLAGCFTALAFHRPHAALGTSPELDGYRAEAGQPVVTLADATLPETLGALLSPERTADLAILQGRLARKVTRNLDAFVGQLVGPARAGASAGGDVTRLALREQSDCLRLLQREVERLRAESLAAAAEHQAFRSKLRIRLAERVYRLVRRIPLLLPALVALVAAAQSCLNVFRHAGDVLAYYVRHLRNVLVHYGRRLSIRSLFACLRRPFLSRKPRPDPSSPSEEATVRPAGLPGLPRDQRAPRWRLFLKVLWLRLGSPWRIPSAQDSSNHWFHRHRPGATLLRRFRSHQWPEHAPRFSLILLLEEDAPAWLQDSLRSVAEQTYPHRELICAAGRPLTEGERSSLGPSVRVLTGSSRAAALRTAVEAAEGKYILWLRHGDLLEPHALHRFAKAILEDAPDLLYCDEASISACDADCVLGVQLRPAFSYDYYLAHDYLGHLVVIRAETLRRAGGLGPLCEAGPDKDAVLRVLERADRVTHLPDVLLRHRLDARQAQPWRGVHADAEAVSAHLRRLGVDAEVRPTPSPACRDVVFVVPRRCRVAILIPTKDRVDLLRRCIDGLEKTVPEEIADVYVIDHESTDPRTVGYLAELDGRCHVLAHRGPFNFSTIMNRAAEQVAARGDYTHYLLLNNDTEALAPGWLEHMLGHAGRAEVGIVGALLLYPDLTVQHAGVLVGQHFAADNRGKRLPAYDVGGQRVPGPGHLLLATQDQEAVTGACLLVRADVFEQLHGMDEGLAVGFGDVDFCLRARELGYKVLFDPHAVLLHHESATRGRDRPAHPEDTRLFRQRYAQRILDWDVYSSPLQDRSVENRLDAMARAGDQVAVRTVPVVLPGVSTAARTRAA